MAKTEAIAGGAVFGALASAISYLHLSLPFLPLPYLEFQFAEIAIVMAVIFYGPIGGLISSFEYLLILEAIGHFAPFGPLLAFMGVISIVLGMVIARSLISYTEHKSYIWRYIAFSMAVATAIRVPLLTAGNLAYFYLVAPNFISYATMMLSKFLGIQSLSSFSLVLLFTAFFNIIQNVVSLVPATTVSLYVFNRWSLGLDKYWLPNFILLHDRKEKID